MDKIDQRKKAVELYYYKHLSKAEICRHLNCSRPWLDRWLNRYDPDQVEQSLRDAQAGPHQPASRWSNEIRQQVLAMRRQRSQREQWPYALIGAEAIHYELIALKSPEVPPVRTIHSWLVQAGLVEQHSTPPEKAQPKLIPLPEATAVNEVQQLDLKGPIYLRGSNCKYYLAVLRDRYSHRCALAVLQSREAQGIVTFLVSSWQWLGLPRYLQLDNALEFRGSNQYPRSFGRIIRVALDLKIELVFIPAHEPWRNGGVGHHNGFLEQRLLSIECADLAALKQQVQLCQQACNQTHRSTPLAGLTPDETVAQVTLQLLPVTYQRHQASTLPQDQGFVSFVRLVRKSGRITLGAGDRFMVDSDLAYSYVLARVDLAQKVVIISQAAQTLKTYDYSTKTVGAWAADPSD